MNGKAHGLSVGIHYIIRTNPEIKEDHINEVFQKLQNITLLENKERLFDVTLQGSEIVLELRNLFLMYLSEANAFLKKKLNINDQVVTAEDVFINRSDITGEHQNEGILTVYGKNIKKGVKLTHASVLDIVPTILYLKGLPVGKDMDGNVLIEAIDEKFVKENPLKYIDTYESDTDTQIDSDTDYSMTEELESRLRDLGYLD